MVPLERSLVCVNRRPHRKVAQENWGLTKEQMKGMHVHHRIPRHQGGTNDPCNLFVCSPSMHQWGWHSGEEFISYASKGGSIGGVTGGRKGRKGKGVYARTEKHLEVLKRFSNLTFEQRSENTLNQWKNPEFVKLVKETASKTGKKLAEQKVGMFSSERLGEGARTTNSQKWVDPLHPELGAHHFNKLAKLQRERGYPSEKTNRVKVQQEEKNV